MPPTIFCGKNEHRIILLLLCVSLLTLSCDLSYSGSCVSGYSIWGDTCVHCPKANTGVIFLLAVVLWGYLVVFHRLAQSTAAETRILLNYGQMILLLFGPGMYRSYTTTILSPL
jgi:hypothetical protein